MKMLSLLLFLSLAVTLCGADFDARAVFGSPPGRDVDAALKRAAKESKRVILFAYDPKEGGLYPGSDITFFMDLLETKKLLKDRFIVVLLTRGHKDLDRYRSPGAPEKAYYALINADGGVAKTEMVSRNGDAGLKTVKLWLALP